MVAAQALQVQPQAHCRHTADRRRLVDYVEPIADAEFKLNQEHRHFETSTVQPRRSGCPVYFHFRDVPQPKKSGCEFKPDHADRLRGNRKRE